VGVTYRRFSHCKEEVLHVQLSSRASACPDVTASILHLELYGGSTLLPSERQQMAVSDLNAEALIVVPQLLNVSGDHAGRYLGGRIVH
jgi:hypothetical protein